MHSKAEIGRLLRAKRRESVQVPFYYAPPFLDRLREGLQARGLLRHLRTLRRPTGPGGHRRR